MTYLACLVLTEAFSKHCLKMHWHLRQQVICRHLLLLFGVSPSTSFLETIFNPNSNMLIWQYFAHSRQYISDT